MGENRVLRGARRGSGLWVGMALLCGMMATPGAAQMDEGRSILTLLPVTGSVSLGDELSGSLSAEDYIAGGRRVQAFEFAGTMGEPVIFDLLSDDFDSYLTLVGPNGREVASDDDSGGACNARISAFLEASGTFLVVASSLSGETGAFTLLADSRQGPPAGGDCGGDAYGGGEVLEVIDSLVPVGTLSLDGTNSATGDLGPDDVEMADGSYVEGWLVSGTPGTTVYIDLASRAFDTLLFVVEPGGIDYNTDDDSGGACNSRMAITLEDEPHTVVVNSLGSGGSGAFTLTVSGVEGPQANGSCPGLLDEWIR